MGAFHARTVAALAGLDFELIVVDDGSRDATGERLRALAAADERVKVDHAVAQLRPPGGDQRRASSTRAATSW